MPVELGKGLARNPIADEAGDEIQQSRIDDLAEAALTCRPSYSPLREA
jgi:hypothetical protein